VAKKAFHGLAQIAAHAVEMTRDARFVLAEEASDFGKRFFLGVIEANPILFPWVKVLEGGLQSAGKECDVAFPVRVERLNRRVLLCAQSGSAGFIFNKLFKAPARANGINVALGKNSAKPGL